LFAGIGDAGGDFGVGGVAEVGGLHLLTQQFQVDEAVENGAAIVVGEAGEGAVAEERFVAQGFIPIGLQNDAAVYGGDDAIDDLRSGRSGGERGRARKRRAVKARSAAGIDRMGGEISLKWLPYAEKNVEVAQTLRLVVSRQLSAGIEDALEIRRRIQIVPEVKAQGADWCLISQTNAHGVRSIVVAAVVE
jgi:hypothetical protein